MRKFMHKAKSALNDFSSDGASDHHFAPSNQHSQQPLPSHDEPADIQPPSPLDVMRYRYQHGTNLGSVFVLERWLTGSMFVEGSGGSAELAGIEGGVKVCVH